MNKDDQAEFKPKNFWEAVYSRPLEKLELDAIQENATAFAKFMTGEELAQKRLKLEIEIYKIDRELADLNKNIFSIIGRSEARKKFESLLTNMKIQDKK